MTELFISRHMLVCDVLEKYPQCRAVFVKYGMGGCGGARGPAAPVEFFATMHGLDTDEFLNELMGVAEAAAPGGSTGITTGGLTSENESCPCGPQAHIESAPACAAESDPCPCGPTDVQPGERRKVELPAQAGPCGCGSAVLTTGGSAKFAVGGSRRERDGEGAKRRGGDGPTACAHGDSTQALVRAFLRTGLAVFLLFGALTGLAAVFALTRPGLTLPPGLLWAELVQSHARAQMYGFVAMMILGFSYHILPRFLGVTLTQVKTAWASYILLIAGTLLRCLFQPFADNSAAGLMSLAGSLMVLGAIGCFAAVVIVSLARSPLGRGLTHVLYLSLGAASLALAALLDVWSGALMWLGRTTLVAPDINTSWIFLALFGFAGLFIFGVGQRALPHFLGAPPRHPALMKIAYAMFITAIILELLSIYLLNPTGMRVLSASLVLAGFSFSLFCIPIFSRRASPPPNPPCFTAFVRTAFIWGWLGAAGSFALAAISLTGAAPQRLWLDAVRHAWALGWVTMLIVGVGYRLIPVFFGRPLICERRVYAAHIALSAAVILRVTGDLAASIRPDFYPLIGVSGLLAWIGVALFAAEVFGLTRAHVAPLRAPEFSAAR